MWSDLKFGRRQLRGTIERAIGDIAAGRARKDDVLDSAIQHFKRDFVTATSKANILVSEVTLCIHQSCS